MIANTLQNKIGEAMKAKDVVLLSTLRMLLSEFNYEKIRLQKDLEDKDEERVIRREIKKRREAIEILTKIQDSKTQNLQASENLQNEKDELKILQQFLPPELSREEIGKLVEESINLVNPSGIKDMGKVMGVIKAKAPSMDGTLVANIVKQKLESRS